MPDISFVYSFVQESFPNVSISRNGTHFNFRCPFCGDSEKNLHKKRFHLQFRNEESIFFNCFNCPAKGNFYDLYGAVKGISSDEAFKELNKFNADRVKKRVSDTSTYKKTQIDFNTKNIFNEFLEKACIPDNHIPSGHIEAVLLKILLDFKKERKINQQLYICKEGTFQKRIIIPVFNGDNCVFFQGRRILETMNPKYLNPSVEKENIILNKDVFDREKYIIVTEGILDAYSVGNQGTAALGASISDMFLEELFKYTDKGIIIALDNDSAGLEQVAKIIKDSYFNKRLSYFFLDKYKDLNAFLVDSDCSDVYKYILDRMDDYLSAYIKIRGII